MAFPGAELGNTNKGGQTPPDPPENAENAALIAFSVLMLNDLMGRTNGDPFWNTVAISGFAIALPFAVMLGVATLTATRDLPEWSLWLFVVAGIVTIVATFGAIVAVNDLGGLLFLASAMLAFAFYLTIVRELAGHGNIFHRFSDGGASNAGSDF